MHMRSQMRRLEWGLEGFSAQMLWPPELGSATLPREVTVAKRHLHPTIPTALFTAAKTWKQPE